MIWKPAGGGVAATVTVIALDLDRDKVQVHVIRASTGACAPHWVDMAALSEGPKEAKPCSCTTKPHEGGEDDHHAA
jgi:hypothetical protein